MHHLQLVLMAGNTKAKKKKIKEYLCIYKHVLTYFMQISNCAHGGKVPPSLPVKEKKEANLPSETGIGRNLVPAPNQPHT